MAVLIDKFVSATALIKFEEVQRALSKRKSKEVRLPRLLLLLRRARAAVRSARGASPRPSSPDELLCSSVQGGAPPTLPLILLLSPIPRQRPVQHCGSNVRPV